MNTMDSMLYGYSMIGIATTLGRWDEKAVYGCEDEHVNELLGSGYLQLPID